MLEHGCVRKTHLQACVWQQKLAHEQPLVLKSYTLLQQPLSSKCALSKLLGKHDSFPLAGYLRTLTESRRSVLVADAMRT